MPFVLWTEKRNFESVLAAIEKGQLDVQSLITERVSRDKYQQIYQDIDSSKVIASVLEYPEQTNTGSDMKDRQTLSIPNISSIGAGRTIAIIGAGNFTRATMLPSLKKVGANIKYIVSSGGLSSMTLAKKYDIAKSTTDLQSVLENPEVNGVLITTRHNLHMGTTIRALKAGVCGKVACTQRARA